MNFMRRNWIQKTGTAFLLVLFVFIHAVKTFHTHDYSYSSSTNNKSVTLVKAGFACAICDFQIAKDSDAQSSTPIIAVPSHAIVALFSYTLHKPLTFSVTSSGRGPPSNIC